MIASQQPILLALVALVLSFGVGTIVFSRRASRDRASLPDSPVVDDVTATAVAVPTETDLEVVAEIQPNVAELFVRSIPTRPMYQQVFVHQNEQIAEQA